MMITDLVTQQFESGDIITLDKIYDSIIEIIMNERKHVNAASLKHTIRGIVRNLVKKGLVVRVRQGTYKKA